jgi:hypothetical protein
MIDIISAHNGQDLGVLDTQAPKAGNILSIQLGSLEYAKDLGIDLAYFLSDDFRFQNESFNSYLIEVLANRGVNVSSIIEVVENLSKNMTINVVPDETSTALIAR